MTQKSPIFIKLCILSLISLSSGFLTPEQELYLDNLVQRQIQEPNQVPGLGLTVVKQTNDANATTFQTFSKGYGYHDLEYSIPLASNTRFLIASISKSFTASVTCKFLSETFPQLGESVLDTPIVQLAPNYKFTLSDRFRTEKTTFRDLLSHRTCLNSYGLAVTAGAFPTKEERVYRYRYITEQCGFRSRFEYSNNMMILAGEVVSHLSGVPFDDMVRNFLTMLEMNDSLIVDAVTDYENLKDMSRGYYLQPDGMLRKMNATHYNGNSGAASGGIISTLQDMAKYIEFHLNDGEFNGHQIIPPNVMKWLRTTSNHLEFRGSWRQENDEKDTSDGVLGYGLGLEVGIYRGWLRIAHDGDLSPFTGTLSLFPAKKLGVISFSNGPGPLPKESGHLFLRNAIFDLLEDGVGSQHFPNIKSVYSGQKSSSMEIYSTKTRIPESELGGLYGHPYEGIFEILYDEQNTTYPLAIQYGKRGTGILQETADVNVYKIEWIGKILSLFYAYNGGHPLSDMRLDFNVPNVVVYIDSDGEIEYKRNATLDTLPSIPWDPISCGPENSI